MDHSVSPSGDSPEFIGIPWGPHSYLGAPGLALSEVFETNEPFIELLYDLYTSLYDLPLVEHHDHVSKELFRYCTKRAFFVNMVATQGEMVFLKRRLGQNLGWELPGSSIHSKRKQHAERPEMFEEAVERMLERDIPNVTVTSRFPIARIAKSYSHAEEMVTHHGLLFAGRVVSPHRDAIESNEDIKGRFVRLDDADELQKLTDFERGILQKFHTQIIPTFEPEHIEAADHEIVSGATLQKFRREFNEKVLKPLVGNPFSSRPIRDKIRCYIRGATTILDVACGDDPFIYELARGTKLCIGSDITWSAVKHLQERWRESHKGEIPHALLLNPIFVNHDALCLPFAKAFDLTLCKNLLHHMPDEKALKRLFESLKKVSRRILIVDPELPRSSRLGAAWNWYYRKFLRDQGQHFQTRQHFEAILKRFFGANNVTFDYLFTVKGYYMFAHVVVVEELTPALIIPPRSVVAQIDRLSRVKSRIRGIVFDLDGVLVDTEPLFFEAIREVLQCQGVAIHQRDYVERDLQNGKSLLEELARRGHVSDLQQLQEDIYSVYGNLLEAHVPEISGATAAVRELAKRYKLAIASSSRKLFIDHILQSLGLGDLFHVIVSREDVGQLKPSPECLHVAASQLGLMESECLLIEDSKRGLRAGVSAGMPVVLIPNDFTRDADFGADAIVLTSLSELTRALL